MTRSLEDRLWEKVDRSAGEDACWPYMPSINRNTYGMIYDPSATCISKVIGTHRAAYELTYGKVQEGLFVCHRCNWKPCCNPSHLYLGTHQQNMFDARKDQLMPMISTPLHAKLTETEVHAIRILYGAWSQAQLAQKFNVSQSDISDILLGKIWKNIEGPLISQDDKGQKTHCHKGHPLTEDNIIYSHQGRNRNCKLCYYERETAKSRRRFIEKHDEINAQRRARRGSTVHRFSEEEVIEILRLYREEGLSYRDLAKRFTTSYSTIKRIINKDYTGTRYAP